MRLHLVAALAAFALEGAVTASAQSTHPTDAPRHTGRESSASSTSDKLSRAEFSATMRKLWEDHVVWTRQFIVSAVADLPDRDLAAERLMRNQADIGDAIKPFYGDKAGEALTALLKGHIAVAAELVGAAKAGRQEVVQAASAKWYANADSIAAFLAGANPNWKPADLRAEMRHHLDLTLGEAVARLKGEWAADIAAYDAVHEHILGMSDVLSSGIARQFPKRFR